MQKINNLQFSLFTRKSTAAAAAKRKLLLSNLVHLLDVGIEGAADGNIWSNAVATLMTRIGLNTQSWREGLGIEANANCVANSAVVFPATLASPLATETP